MEEGVGFEAGERDIGQQVFMTRQKLPELAVGVKTPRKSAHTADDGGALMLRTAVRLRPYVGRDTEWAAY